MIKSPVSATVPFDADGVHHGFLKLPHSRDDSAWGSVMIPITVARRGDGPTVLLTGANHGDEYEGPVALLELAQTIRADAITGRVIIVPAMNHPALCAGTRTSPIDGGNMNRSFPGRPDGSITEKIADYFQRTLLPLSDVVVDIHSGGRTLAFVPFAASHVLPDAAQQQRCAAARDAFNAPYSMTMIEMDAASMYDTAAEQMGKTFVTTEIGGGGSLSATSAAIARKGVANILSHAGVTDAPMQTAPSVALRMPDQDAFLLCQDDGIMEPCVDLGGAVRAGEAIARIWPTRHTGQPPADYHAPIDGLLAGRHFPGKISHGDCLAVIAVPA